jgi:anti-anti-sigma regulatory factor
MLIVHTNLMRVDHAGFEVACRELCARTMPSVHIDLTRCTYLSSMFIGTLVDCVVQMKVDGKTVGVRVSPEIGHFLNMAHLYHLFSYEIEVVPEHADVGGRSATGRCDA